MSADELADIGGVETLSFADDRAMLRAAAEALSAYGAQEVGDRHARLILLAGYLFGMSMRVPNTEPGRTPPENEAPIPAYFRDGKLTTDD